MVTIVNQQTYNKSAFEDKETKGYAICVSVLALITFGVSIATTAQAFAGLDFGVDLQTGTTNIGGPLVFLAVLICGAYGAMTGSSGLVIAFTCMNCLCAGIATIGLIVLTAPDDSACSFGQILAGQFNACDAQVLLQLAIICLFVLNTIFGGVLSHKMNRSSLVVINNTSKPVQYSAQTYQQPQQQQYQQHPQQYQQQQQHAGYYANNSIPTAHEVHKVGF